MAKRQMNREAPLRKFPTLRMPKIRRYPIWNARTLSAMGLIVAGIAALLVFVIGRWSFFVELEVTLGVVAACLFVFLTIGLYRGIRIRKERFPKISAGLDRNTWRDDDWSDLASHGVPDFSFDFDVGEGCLGALVGIVLSLLLFLLILFFASLLLPLFWAGVLIVIAAVWWVFYLALRRVFAMSRRCRQNLGRSMMYGAWYTALYTTWLFLLLIAARFWLGK